MTENIDVNLNLTFDRYLLSFESLKVIKELQTEYISEYPQIYNYREMTFESTYPILYEFLQCINLKSDLDIEELFFVAYIAYKLKGAKESLTMILDQIHCESEISLTTDTEGERVLDLKIDYIETTNPYLAQRNLIRLCKDLLFFTKYSIKIDKISTIYEITGNVNKTYFTVSSYYVDSDEVIDTQTISW